MPALLTNKLRAGGDLTTEEVAVACDRLLDEREPLGSRADFLRALHEKGETPAEIAAFVRVLLARAVRPELDGGDVLDVCGTGGDRAGLFNVSTAVMFVAAAGGARVVKHGNRGITSKSGGADVLEALGVRIAMAPERAGEILEAAGCCFLFAPLYHPAFKAVAPVRKHLADEGRATVFNMLGPLLNPAVPAYQLAGVFDKALLPIYAETFRLLGRKRAWAVHGAGGLDEVSILGSTLVYSLDETGVSKGEIRAADHGIAAARLEDLLGGNASENANLIESLLRGKVRGPKRDLVAINAACALVVAGRANSLSDGLSQAGAALDDGAGFRVLEILRAFK